MVGGETRHRKRLLAAPAGPAVLALLLLGAPAPGVSAESRQIITIDAVHSVTRLDEGEWSATGLGLAELDLRSTGNRQARGQLRVTAAASADGSTDAAIDRAFVKVRLPFAGEQWFHITAGRARLSWGDGAYFNAADTLYGRASPSANFLEDTLRDEASWILAGFFPLGRFSFVEPVVLVPGVDLLSESPTPPGIENSAAGFRIQGKLREIKAEASYLYDGGVAGGNNPGGGLSPATALGTDEPTAEEGASSGDPGSGFGDLHRPAVSLQGNLGVDWYLSASTAVAGPLSEAPSDYWQEELALSLGLLHIVSYQGGDSLSLRLESLVLPWQAWEPPVQEGTYALELFPEIIWSPNSSVSLYLRTLVSPIDLSAQLTPGVRWNAVEGVTFYSFVNVLAGEESDSYGFGRPGGFSFLAGLEYVY